MRFEKIEIDPQKNPAVLDTATWEPKSAWRAVCAVDESHWNLVTKAIRERHFSVSCLRVKTHHGRTHCVHTHAIASSYQYLWPYKTDFFVPMSLTSAKALYAINDA